VRHGIIESLLSKNPQYDSFSIPRRTSTSNLEDADSDRHGVYPGMSQRALGYASANFEQVPSHDPPVESSGTLTNLAFPWLHPQQPKTNIYGGTFIGGNVNHTQRQGETGELLNTFVYILVVEASGSALHILHRASAGDAFHDSAERYPQPRCHPETRTKLLDTLWKWACGTEPRRNYSSELDDDDDDDEDHPSGRILWLQGPAGSGKSAVAQSFCQKLKAEGRLGGSFFFKRGHPSRGNAKKLFPTIAYQLALLLSELNHSITQTMDRDPAIIDRHLLLQLQKLIIEPCQQSTSGPPVVIVIDGLDECDGRNIQQEILRSLGHSYPDGGIPLRFFIASRPEPHIEQIVSSLSSHCLLNVERSFEDVRKYLQNQFSRIHQQHHETMAKVPTPWPSFDIIEHLTENSSGHFIYASTVIKFVDDEDYHPTERLDIVMGITVSESSEAERPFHALDELYIQILSQTRLDIRPRVLAILSVVLTDLDLDVYHIEQLLQLKPGHVRLALRSLHSVLSTGDYDYPLVTVHHASFRDFLQDPTRSGTFCVGGEQHRINLSRHLLRAFTCNYDNQSMNSQYQVAL
jgi:ABC-type dipeptide/oligopeptide/nickel transport system ATPase component